MLPPFAGPHLQLTTKTAAYAKLLQKHNRLMAACDKHRVTWHRDLDPSKDKKRKRGAAQAQQVGAAAAAAPAAPAPAAPAQVAAVAAAAEFVDVDGFLAELEPDFQL